MRRTLVQKQRRGATLIELSVALFLFLIVLGLTSSALTSGVKNYLSVRSEVELQQDALTILSRLSREVGESHPDTTWPPPVPNSSLTPTGTNPTGIVFSSPRDVDGHLTLDSNTRRPIWQKRICYFLDPVSRNLFRATRDLATPSANPPTLDATLTTGWFQTNSAIDPMPGRVESFGIEVGSTTSSFDFDIVVSNSSLGRVTRVQFLGHATMRP